MNAKSMIPEKISKMMFSLLFIPFLLNGCSTLSSPESGDKRTIYSQPSVSAVSKIEDIPPLQSSLKNMDGSLWVEGGDLSQMFINAKARRVGDILTIRIVESSSASNKASTKTGRNSGINAGLDNFFNLEGRYPSTSPFFNPFGRVKADFASNFDGSGSTARSNALTAFMTARIVDILPNGNLIIEGNREVRVNHENQIITLSGMVRPRDISADNVVQSTYLADARITYSGSGIINDGQRPGWLSRIMGKVWPF